VQDDQAADGGDGSAAPSHAADDASATDDLAVYRFDPSAVTAASALWDEAHSGARYEWHAVEALAELAPPRGWSRETPLVRELIFTAAYRLDPAGPGENAGAVLGPQRDPPDGPCYPPAFRDRTADSLALLDAVASRAREPAAAARVNDVLFEARHGNGRRRAESAASAYRALAASAATGPDPDDARDLAARSLLRAWTLTRTVGAWPTHDEITDELLDVLEDGLAEVPGLVGVLVPLLAAAVAPLRRKQPLRPDAEAVRARADAALDRALDAYAHRGDLARELTDLLRGRTDDPVALANIDRREVQIHLDDAASHEGGRRQAALVEAIAVARDRGLDEMRDDATRQLQAMRPPDLAMQTIRSTVSLPLDVIERYKSGFTRGTSWRPGLTFFLSTSPPTGSRRALEESTDQGLARPSLRRLLTTVHLNPQALPTATSRPGTDEALARELARTASHVAGLQGLILADGLARTAAMHGVPTEDAVAAHLLALGAADQRLARSYARALRLFWRHEYEACVHLVVPKIEAAARLVLRECDVATFRTQVGASLGGYAGLQPLLAALRDSDMDEDWHFFLTWLLLTPGENVRNDVAHGLLAEPTASYAALALRAAGLVILMAPSSAALGWDDERDGRVAADSDVPDTRSTTDVRQRLLKPLPGTEAASPSRRNGLGWAARRCAARLRGGATRLLDAADRLA